MQELLSTRDFVDTVLWPALWSCSIGDTGVRIDVAAGGHMCLMTGCNRMGVACDCYVATLRRNPEQRPEREACRPEQQLDRADRRTGPMQRTDRGSPYSRRR